MVLALMPILSVAGAQTLSVVGVVRDSAGAPVQSAEVSILGRRASSDSLGRFYLSLPQADSLSVQVRRLGYESLSFSVTAKDVTDNTLDVVLRRVAEALESVEVSAMSERAKTGLRGFDDRRATGVGVFVTRQEIEKRNATWLADVLRTARGVVMSRNHQLRFTNYQAKNCNPMVWMDGQQARGLSLDAVSAMDVEGVELYQSVSTTPPEFRRANQQTECGTIVIWTKRPRLELQRRKP